MVAPPPRQPARNFASGTYKCKGDQPFAQDWVGLSRALPIWLCCRLLVSACVRATLARRSRAQGKQVGGRLKKSWVSATAKPWGSPARERGRCGPDFFPRSGGGTAGRPGSSATEPRATVAGGWGRPAPGGRAGEEISKGAPAALLHRRAGGAVAPPSARRAGLGE
jgi:hypothetical protein